MLYHLLAPLGKQHLIFNLFNYISFRAAGATVTALLLAFLVGPGIIRRLRELKVGQVIRAEGPASAPGQARHADDGRGDHPDRHHRPHPALGAARQPLRRSSRCWPPSGWARSASSTTTSRSCRGGRAGWWRARSWRGRSPSGSPSGSTCCTTPWRRSATIPAPRPRCRSSSTLVVNFAPWLYVVFVTFVITGEQQRGEPHRRARRPGHRPDRHRRRHVRLLRLPLRPLRRDPVPQALLPARRRRAGDLLRRR